MPATWLSCINASLKRARVIEGTAYALATSTVTSTATGLTATEAFTDASRQNQIDIMLQCWNEAIQGVFSFGMLAKEAATGSITLATTGREYSLPSDFEKMAGMDYQSRVLRGATTGMIVYEYPGGYAQMLADQARATDWVGEPNAWALSPVSDVIRLDRETATGSVGDTYYFLYDKRVAFTSTMATEAMPFSDTVCDALVPVAAEMWARTYKKEMDGYNLQTSLTRALEYAGRTQRRSRWGQVRVR